MTYHQSRHDPTRSLRNYGFLIGSSYPHPSLNLHIPHFLKLFSRPFMPSNPSPSTIHLVLPLIFDTLFPCFSLPSVHPCFFSLTTVVSKGLLNRQHENVIRGCRLHPLHVSIDHNGTWNMECHQHS